MQMLPKINHFFKEPNDNSKIYPDYEYKLNFDGCSKGNPGLAGAGAVLYKNNVEVWADYAFVGENSTNNQAEYAGLILGLQYAKDIGIKSLLVAGDSLLVINHMKRIYKCKSPNLIEIYDKAKNLARQLDAIEYLHVLRHLNKRADELSNIAVEQYVGKC
jgi:ribonuclease HI